MQPFDLRLWPQFSIAGGDIHTPAIIDQVAIDSRRIVSPQSLFVALPGRQLDGHRFIAEAAKQGALYALVQNNYQPESPLPAGLKILRVNNTLQAFQQIAAAYRQQLKTTVIGITGSMGKTMVKDLLEAILSQEAKTVASPESFNSQIGVPMSLFQVDNSHRYALIEAGISQRGDMQSLTAMIAPDHAILTNIANSHLSHWSNKEEYLIEKMALLKSTPPENWIVLPKNYISTPYSFNNKPAYAWDELQATLPHAWTIGPLNNAQQIPYEIHFPNANLDTPQHSESTNTSVIDNTSHATDVNTLHSFIGNIPGGHTYLLEHINIAIKTAWLLGISAHSIRQAISQYAFYPIRVERFKTLKGATIINERYCSDVSSLETALHQLREETHYKRKIFLFGGIRHSHLISQLEYQQIVNTIARSNIDYLFLVGTEIFTSLKPLLLHLPAHCHVECFNNHFDALSSIADLLQEGDLVLIKGAKAIPLPDLELALDATVCDNKLVINLAAIEDNLHVIRNHLAPGTRIMAMIKALGYGTDSISLGRFLEKCHIDILGVAHVDEAVLLRQAGVTQSIFSIHMTPDEATQVVRQNIEVAISDVEQIHALEDAAQLNSPLLQNKKIAVHLHIDTGMGRLGCRTNQALAVAQAIVASPHLNFAGVMTHLAASDNADDDLFTQHQLQHFSDIVNQLKQNNICPPWIHAANSSGAMRFPQSPCNMVRLGLGMFGLAPGLPLRPALALLSRLIGINHLNAGESVGYGHTYRATRNEERIGVVPLGYFDGLHTQYSGKGHVLIRGLPAPLIGRICMDFLMVDITDIPEANIGDAVLVFGKNESGHYIDPVSVAANAGTHAYQLITCLGPRIRRLFIYDEGL